MRLPHEAEGGLSGGSYASCCATPHSTYHGGEQICACDTINFHQSLSCSSSGKKASVGLLSDGEEDFDFTMS